MNSSTQEREGKDSRKRARESDEEEDRRGRRAGGSRAIKHCFHASPRRGGVCVSPAGLFA